MKKEKTASNQNKQYHVGVAWYATQNKQPHVGAGPVSAQNAITLVALVITVIILLILAGVTINLTIGNNGIFNTAQKAAKNHTDAQNKELGELNQFNDTVQAISAKQGTIIKNENNIKYTSDGAGNIIPVPEGFSPITAEEGQGTKDTGFVIRNDVDKNEFVWIPVEGMGYTYDRYDFEKQDGMYSEYSENEPIDEQNSVTNYGGYYIGRYEAGIVSTIERSESDMDAKKTAEEIEKNWGKALSQKRKHTYNYVTRNQAKGLAESVYIKANDNVTSKLCSSYAWDTALNFIKTKYPKYPINSIGGNYNTDSGGTNTLQKTEYHSVNNIYDMGGNVWEWTTELCSNANYPYVVRGGDCSSGASYVPASYRSYNYTTSSYNSVIAFRLALFI